MFKLFFDTLLTLTIRTKALSVKRAKLSNYSNIVLQRIVLRSGYGNAYYEVSKISLSAYEPKLLIDVL